MEFSLRARLSNFWKRLLMALSYSSHTPPHIQWYFFFLSFIQFELLRLPPAALLNSIPDTLVFPPNVVLFSRLCMSSFLSFTRFVFLFWYSVSSINGPSGIEESKSLSPLQTEPRIIYFCFSFYYLGENNRDQIPQSLKRFFNYQNIFTDNIPYTF